MQRRQDAMGRRDAPDAVRQMAQVALFEGLPDEALARVVALAHSTHLDSGGFFFSEGDSAESFFVLTTGRVKLTQLTPAGQQVVLRLIGPGEAFGGVGAFGEPTYPVSAEAIETSVALAWTSTTMRQLLETRIVLTRPHALVAIAEDLPSR